MSILDILDNRCDGCKMEWIIHILGIMGILDLMDLME